MFSTQRIFNVIPSPPDKRDLVYTTTLKMDGSADLRSFDSPVEDQGTLGSCVSHAVTSAYENMLSSTHSAYVELSRLFLYYHTRLLENSVAEDAGVVYLRNAMKAGDKYGLCIEELWNYDANQFDDQPSPDSYADSCSRKIVNYKRVPNITDMIDALNKNKPIVIGFEIYPSFSLVSSETPVVPVPHITEPSIGGHSVCIVGYLADKQQFIFKNSYGIDWGENGYGYMPIEYVRLFVFDKWVFDITPL